MKTRLLCFPPAGASAGVFASWRPHVAGSVELVALESPGRGARADEPPIGDIRTLVERFLPEVAALAEQGPFVLFGHSMGAKIAFEVARALGSRGLEPLHLVVAASPSNTFPSRGKGIHLLARDQLVGELRQMGVAEAVLRDERLLDLLLPSIRADLQLATEYEVLPGPMLTCPITAFAGTHDPDITVEDVAGWWRHTTGIFQLVRIDAGHNFIKERALVDEVVRAARGARHVSQS